MSHEVRQIIADRFGVPITSVADEVTFTTLRADSLDCVELAMELEEKLNIIVEDDDMADCETVGEVIALVERVKGEVA